MNAYSSTITSKIGKDEVYVQGFYDSSSKLNLFPRRYREEPFILVFKPGKRKLSIQINAIFQSHLLLCVKTVVYFG